MRVKSVVRVAVMSAFVVGTEPTGLTG